MRTAWCYGSLVGLLMLSVTVGIDRLQYHSLLQKLVSDRGRDLKSC